VLPVDQLQIEHAQSVPIQLDDEHFVTYFGRSDIYPNGRMVKYKAKEWSAIPELNEDNTATEYMIGDEIHNPLTYWQDKTGDYEQPEYPVITWQGTTAGVGTELLPVQTNLYDTSEEIDLSSSRTAMSANKAARGAWFFSNEGGASPNQPASIDEGMAKLENGQSVFVLSVPAGNIDVADKVNQNTASYLADEWSVPAYLISVDTDVQIPSGKALVEVSKPQVKMQNRRKDINDSQMARMFQIEKALAGMENGAVVGENIEQVWTLKSAEIFKTDIEKLQELQIRKDLEITDKVHILAEVDGVTVEQAQKQIDALVVVPVPNTTGNRIF
jgi:hypothetical protein